MEMEFRSYAILVYCILYVYTLVVAYITVTQCYKTFYSYVLKAHVHLKPTQYGLRNTID